MNEVNILAQASGSKAAESNDWTLMTCPGRQQENWQIKRSSCLIKGRNKNQAISERHNMVFKNVGINKVLNLQ